MTSQPEARSYCSAAFYMGQCEPKCRTRVRTAKRGFLPSLQIDQLAPQSASGWQFEPRDKDPQWPCALGQELSFPNAQNLWRDSCQNAEDRRAYKARLD